MKNVANDIKHALKNVIGHNSKPIALHEPSIGDNEVEEVTSCIRSTFVSSIGPQIEEFETSLSEITGAKNVVAVSNGTSALQLALQASDLQFGSEVIVPSLSFIATANAVIHAGLCPNFVDVDSKSLGIDVEKLSNYLETKHDFISGKLINKETGRQISAIVPMHTLGFPCDIQAIIELASKYSLTVIEDAAESLGSYVGTKHTGTFAKVGIVSFNGNKIITTGGGGALLCDDPLLAKRIRHISTTAKLPHPWDFHHDQLGWNMRMPNLNASLGLAQIKRLPELLLKKKSLSDKYREEFLGYEGIEFLETRSGTTANNWLCAIKIDGMTRQERDESIELLHSEGFLVRPLWGELSKQTHLSEFSSAETPCSGKLINEVICLPSSAHLINR